MVVVGTDSWDNNVVCFMNVRIAIAYCNEIGGSVQDNYIGAAAVV